MLSKCLHAVVLMGLFFVAYLIISYISFPAQLPSPKGWEEVVEQDSFGPSAQEAVFFLEGHIDNID